MFAARMNKCGGALGEARQDTMESGLKAVVKSRREMTRTPDEGVGGERKAGLQGSSLGPSPSGQGVESRRRRAKGRKTRSWSF